jgi:hypothetical protein
MDIHTPPPPGGTKISADASRGNKYEKRNRKIAKNKEERVKIMGKR